MRRILVGLTAAVALAAGCGPGAEPGAGPGAEPRATSGRGDTPRPTGSESQREAPPANAAPGFAVTTFTGDRFALADHKGTPVVLNFWESW